MIAKFAAGRISDHALGRMFVLGSLDQLRARLTFTLGGSKMSDGKRNENRPLSYCEPCSERTPHRYERVGVDGQLTSRAICLICNNDSRNETARQSLNGKPSEAHAAQPGVATTMRRRTLPNGRRLRRRARRASVAIQEQS